MKKLILIFLFIIFSAAAAHAQTASLGWTDNANNEDGVRIYRRIGTAAPVMIPLSANATAYIDSPGSAAVGQTVCYQVAMYNTAGESTRIPTIDSTSNCKPFPSTPPVVQVPVPPGALGFNWVCPAPKVYNAATNSCQ